MPTLRMISIVCALATAAPAFALRDCDEAAIEWAVKNAGVPGCSLASAHVVRSEQPSPNAFHVTVRFQCGTQWRQAWVPMAKYNGTCMYNGG